MTVIVGGTLADDLAAFRTAWEQAERGEHVERERFVEEVATRSRAAKPLADHRCDTVPLRVSTFTFIREPPRWADATMTSPSRRASRTSE
jgi:hypothetical protein